MKNWKVLILISMVLPALTGPASAGEILYNGIVLPDQWPPKVKELVREPRPVPYLKNSPAVIPIDVRDNIETSLGWISFLEEFSPRPIESDGSRRRYSADFNYVSSGEPRSLIFTPYADAGNEGAAFRTVFPLAQKEN